MLEKIQKNITSKVVVLLEGGYNLSNIPPVAESVLRCLKGESLPNMASPLQMCNMDSFVSQTKVPESWANVTEDNVKVWAEFWPFLMNEGLIEECKKMINYQDQTEENQIVGDNFYKLMNSQNLNNEALVYSLLDSKYPILKDFLPECLGLAVKTSEGINNQDLK